MSHSPRMCVNHSIVQTVPCSLHVDGVWVPGHESGDRWDRRRDRQIHLEVFLIDIGMVPFVLFERLLRRSFDLNSPWLTLGYAALKPTCLVGVTLLDYIPKRTFGTVFAGSSNGRLPALLVGPGQKLTDIDRRQGTWPKCS